jgi:two-component system, OmpR family, response regulator VicR
MTDHGRQPHILIINDTQEILDLMQELLEEEGYRVTQSLALLNMDRVKALAPDIIAQDIMFEHSQNEGWKMLHLMRLDPELVRIPIVLCTAAVSVVRDEAMAEQLNRLGVRVVLKPFNIAELLQVMSEVRTAQSLINQATETSTGDGHVPSRTLRELGVLDPVSDDAPEQ